MQEFSLKSRASGIFLTIFPVGESLPTDDPVMCGALRCQLIVLVVQTISDIYTCDVHDIHMHITSYNMLYMYLLDMFFLHLERGSIHILSSKTSGPTYIIKYTQHIPILIVPKTTLFHA